MKILNRSFYQRDTVIVAQELLGKIVMRKINGVTLAGIIVETEAYCFDDDPASHAYRGKTKRNAPMFGMVGYTYVYFIYGNHFCLNIVAKSATTAAGALLIRALEPLQGIEVMRRYRYNNCLKEVTNGPGKLAQALQITTVHNFIDVTKNGSLFIVDKDIHLSRDIIATTRIGITVGSDKQWRFCLRNNKWLSRKM
ncbi:MAG TPA: DNA-3-methyladenine glycosylase [Candidatus Dependentiae bacterium]|nr:DNA-3-methyladenine glycosylase [Candidatus Dependentiae bacterium]